MKRRSLTGPLVLLLVGGLFLWRNLHPEAPIFEMAALYWPFLLIAWGVMRLVEALIWRNRGYRTGLSGGEVVLIIFLCLAGSAFFEARQHGFRFGNGLELWGRTYDYPVSASASAEGMKRVFFETRRGNITVRGGDTKQIEVRGRRTIRGYSRQEADRTNQSARLEIVPQGDRLLVRTNQDRAPQNQRVSDDLEVVIPRGMTVESRTASGDYDISDIEGDVQLSCDRGDVRLNRLGGNARLEIGRSDLIRAADVKGSLDLRGEGEDVELSNVAGQVTITGGYRGSLDFKNLAKPLLLEGARGTEFRAQAVPGRITMDLGSFSGRDIVGPVRLVTRSRDVTIEQFTLGLELQTERGDIQLTPGRAPVPPIEARTGTGRIDLVLPAKAAFRLQATAETGDAVNDFGPPIQKDVSGRTATLTGESGNGPAIRLTAGRGWISVRKEGSAPSREPDRRDSETPSEPSAEI